MLPLNKDELLAAIMAAIQENTFVYHYGNMIGNGQGTRQMVAGTKMAAEAVMELLEKLALET